MNQSYNVVYPNLSQEEINRQKQTGDGSLFVWLQFMNQELFNLSQLVASIPRQYDGYQKTVDTIWNTYFASLICFSLINLRHINEKDPAIQSECSNARQCSKIGGIKNFKDFYRFNVSNHLFLMDDAKKVIKTIKEPTTINVCLPYDQIQNVSLQKAINDLFTIHGNIRVVLYTMGNQLATIETTNGKVIYNPDDFIFGQLSYDRTL